MKFPRLVSAVTLLFALASFSVSAQVSVSISGNQILCMGDSLALTANVVDASQTCDYFLEMDDTFGDGWNGAVFSLSVNGVTTDYTFFNGFSDSVYIPVAAGDLLQVSFTSGGYPEEESYVFYDAQGSILLNDGPFPTNGVVYTGTADCGASANPLTVQWSPATGVSDPTSLNPTFAPAATTTYMIEVLDSVGTTVATDSVTIVVAPNFAINPTASPAALCLNGSSALDPGLTGNGTYTYDWNLGHLLDDSTIAMPTATFGTFGNFDFEVEVTSDSGCVKSAVVPVFVSGSVPSEISATNDTTCMGVPVDVAVGIEATVSPSCNYELQLVNQNGQGWQGDSLKIYANGQLIHATTLPSGFAAVETLTLTDADSIEVEFVQNSFAFGNIYQLSDPNGNVIFQDGPFPQPGIVFGFTADCGISFDGWQYAWSPSTGLSSTSGNEVTVTINADQTYTIVASDTVCGYYDTTTVTISAVPTFGYTVTPGDTGFCLGAVVQLNAVPDTSSGYAFTWNNAAWLDDPNIANPVATLNNPGSYEFEVLMSSPWGCDITESFTIGISANPTPEVSIWGGPGVCDGESVMLTASTGPAQGTQCAYVLEMYDTFGDGWNGAELAFTVNGSTTFHTFQNGNFAVDTLPVSHGDSISVAFVSGGYPEEESYILYDGDGNVVLGDGPFPQNGAVYSGVANCGGNTDVVYLYDWQPNIWVDDNTLESPTFSPMADTTYVATVTDSIGGCSASDTIDLFIAYFTPVQVLQITDTFCSGDIQSLQMFASEPNGNWTGEGLTDDSLGIWVPNAAGAGSHAIVYTLNDFGGCVSSDSTVIEVLLSPNSPTITPVAGCEGDEVVLTASTTAGDLLWYNDSQLSDFVGQGDSLNVGAITGSGEYWVIASNGDCNSAPAALPYDIQVPASTANINGPTEVDEWTLELYNVPQTIGSTYNWVVTGGNITSGQGGNFISLQWTGGTSGTLAVVETTSGGCEGDTVTLNVTINPTAVGEVAPQHMFEAWPVPASDKIFVALPEAGNYRTTLTDCTGRVVWSTNGAQASRLEIPAGALPNGVYMLTVTGSQTWHSRVAVQH